MNVGKASVPVSVVIPCFRCSSTIERAINSIVHQKQKPEEVILVDDASGDDTLSVLYKLEKQYRGWVKIVAFNVNKGAASARNAGWAIAQNPYVAFLDADDSWHPEKIRIQYEYMQANQDVVLCGHQCVFINNYESSDLLFMRELKEVVISPFSLLFRNAFSTPTVMLFRDIPFRFLEKKRFAEDYLLWQHIAWAGGKIVRIESPLAYIHKPAYGTSGLSAQLWNMERGELDNFMFLYYEGYIGAFLCIISASFSIIKFLKRLFVTEIQRLADSFN
jgi:glycosyltransferase involved in cell wall biosynthesis